MHWTLTLSLFNDAVALKLSTFCQDGHLELRLRRGRAAVRRRPAVESSGLEDQEPGELAALLELDVSLRKLAERSSLERLSSVHHRFSARQVEGGTAKIGAIASND